MMTKVEKMMNKRELMNEWTVEIRNLNDSVFCLNRPFTALSHKYSFHNKKMNLATAIFISLIPKNIRKKELLIIMHSVIFFVMNVKELQMNI